MFAMLRTRLILNLAAFVVLILAMGLSAIVLFSRMAGRVDATVTGNYRSILIAQSMRLELAAMEKEAWTSASRTNITSPIFDLNEKQFETNLDVITGTVLLPGEDELHGNLTNAYSSFIQAVTALNSARDEEGRRNAYQLGIMPSVLEIDTALGKIRDLNNQAIVATPGNIQKVTRDVTRLMVISVVIALGVSIYVCYQVSRSILQPIQSLTGATRELGEGRWPVPMPIVARDELGELARAFNHMAAQLQEYRESTTEQIVRLHRTMESTLASFPDPIFVLNRAGRIELKNPAAEEFAAGLGLKDQLPGTLQAIAEDALGKDQNFLPHSFAGAVSYRLGGREKFFLPRVLAMHDKQAALFGVAVVLYDVTRFRLLDAAKTNLVATVSHELKTPLTGVRMALHLLLEKTVGALQPKQEELLQAARDDAERLLRILNDLLDLARLDEGNAELRREPVAPAELIENVAKECADQAAARGVKLICALDTQLPAVLVDRQRIGHVFVNLVTNAIKHSAPNSEVLLKTTRNDEDSVQFSVTDRGAGIPDGYHARIFDRFFRVPGQNKTGAGLGLSIAREITVAHGGRIGVTSSPGRGSTFFVTLPAAIVAPEAR